MNPAVFLTNTPREGESPEQTAARYRIGNTRRIEDLTKVSTEQTEPYLPTDPKERKEYPICTGVLDYFPLALLEVARVSKAGNDQHNPGEPLHWARGKSMDQADTIVRHIMERGSFDIDGQRHMAKAAWRVLALLQIEMEQATGKPISRGSTND